MLRILLEKKGNYWLATCLELNICAQGNSLKDVSSSIQDAIRGYLETVVNTKDKLSIPDLLNRPAPFKKRAMFWFAEKKYHFKSWQAIQLKKFSKNNFSNIAYLDGISKI